MELRHTLVKFSTPGWPLLLSGMAAEADQGLLRFISMQVIHSNIPHMALLPTAHKEDSAHNKTNYDEWNQDQQDNADGGRHR
ncbi:MAG: hypothetical protein E6I93_14770 [Chloroflexi bacterium]|nr:MAG: hypothetical protein E6I93_14770 [Chloroflexota bacterium]